MCAKRHPYGSRLYQQDIAYTECVSGWRVPSRFDHQFVPMPGEWTCG